LSLNISFCLSLDIRYLSYKKSCNFSRAKSAAFIAHSVPFSDKCSKALLAKSMANFFIQFKNIPTKIFLAPISSLSSLGAISLSIKSITCCSWSSFSSVFSGKEILLEYCLTNSLL